MSAQKVNIVDDVMALAAEFTRLKIDRASWGVVCDATTNAAHVELENYVCGVAARITALEAQNAELLAALQRMLTEFGGDTGGIGAKGRCEALCGAREAVEKHAGSAS